MQSALVGGSLLLHQLFLSLFALNFDKLSRLSLGVLLHEGLLRLLLVVLRLRGRFLLLLQLGLELLVHLILMLLLFELLCGLRLSLRSCGSRRLARGEGGIGDAFGERLLNSFLMLLFGR